MNTSSRLENSAKNTLIGSITQVINIFLGLLVRTVFIRCLSAEYLGVNGFFSNVLTILSLAELGVGGAIIFHMYKPVAQNDTLQIAKLMNLYKTAYRIIGSTILVVGLSIVPFLDYIIKDKKGINDLTGIYLLFLLNTVVSYFFAFKKSIFSADQRERVLHLLKFIFVVIRSLLQILVLYLFKDFYLYLIIQILCTLSENVAASYLADRQYSFLKKYRKERLDKVTKKVIFNDIKALFIYKLGATALDGTDNIIISATNGVVSVGLLSNYSLVTGSLSMLLSQVSGSITGSVGNFVAKEEKTKQEKLFNNLFFCYYILYGMTFVVMMGTISTFVQWWAGDDYVLSKSIVFIHLLNLYIYGMMGPVWTYRSTMGLFRYGKWRPLISAVINLVISIWWAHLFGLIGVLLGTTFTRIVTNVWFDPYIVFKYGFHNNPLSFYSQWISKLIVVIIDICIVQFFSNFIFLKGITGIFVYAMISALIFIISIIIFYGRDDSYVYFLGLIQRIKNRGMRK